MQLIMCNLVIQLLTTTTIHLFNFTHHAYIHSIMANKRFHFCTNNKFDLYPSNFFEVLLYLIILLNIFDKCS